MISRSLFIASLLAAGAPAVFAAASAEPTKEQAAFFENKIRPILSERCYRCHSVEKGKSKGGLTLDTREGVLKGGEDGPAIKAGEPSDSPIIKAVRYEDKELQMPPSKDDGGGKLSDGEIAALTEWVKMGAPDPRKDVPVVSKMTGLTDKARQHWAYQPVKNPTPPAVKDSAWGHTAVDAFVLAKLEEKNLKPMHDASKEALLRRATYDLIGLPPSPEEMEAFVSDTAPDAFAKVVDRLLATPAYGERWGRFWLDSARYSDTIGGDKNAGRRNDYRYPYAWTYRDYVVKAFNNDKPYNQFIVEQLAADQLPDIKTNDERMAALGFLTVGERFTNVNDIINDRIDTVSKGFLGLTVACARCHDHKFDPIPTTDYYALHGIFVSTFEPNDKPVISEPAPAKLEEFQKQLTAIEDQDRQMYYRVLQRETSKFRSAPTAYLTAAHRKKGAAKGMGTEEEIKARNELIAKYHLDPELLQEIARRSRFGASSIFAPYRMFAELDAAEFTAKVPDVLADIAAGKNDIPARIAAAGKAGGGFGKGGVYGKGGRFEPEPAGINPLVQAAFKDANPQSMEEVAAIYTKLFADCQTKADAFFKACAEAKELPVPGFDPALAQLLQFPFKVEAGGALTTDHLRELTGLWPQKMLYGSGFLFSKVNELELTNPGAPAKAMIVADIPTPRNSPVFIRGQAESRGDIVPRHFLEILSNGNPQPFTQGSGRLELANAIANPANPLTARVLVNRVWMHHFGEGFVRTLDDLGTQSEPPSHPELLDYLASYFMANDWSIKKLHRLIMLSRVYQESSDTNHAYEQVDSQNRLLWHANIRRLDFEALRDSLLVFSGKLDRTVGGQPVNLTEEPYSYRRSVYGYIDRGNLPELMQTFDFSDPDMPNSKRATTVVPQQALFLMNSPMSVDVARRIVARPEITEASDDLSKVTALYHVIFQRNPKPAEIQLAMQFVSTEKDQPQGTPAAEAKEPMRTGKRFGGGGKGGYRDGFRAIQNEGEIVERKPLTPWETYAQALLFSNEEAT